MYLAIFCFLDMRVVLQSDRLYLPYRIIVCQCSIVKLSIWSLLYGSKVIQKGHRYQPTEVIKILFFSSKYIDAVLITLFLIRTSKFGVQAGCS